MSGLFAPDSAEQELNRHILRYGAQYWVRCRCACSNIFRILDTLPKGRVKQQRPGAIREGIGRSQEVNLVWKLEDLDVWFWLVCLTLVLTIICGMVCHRIAIRQEGDLVFWGVLGFLFGPIAIPITWLLAGRQFKWSRAADS